MRNQFAYIYIYMAKYLTDFDRSRVYSKYHKRAVGLYIVYVAYHIHLPLNSLFADNMQFQL
jgi:hypothetical protein